MVKVFVLMALTIVMVRQQHSLKPLYLPSLIYQQLADFSIGSGNPHAADNSTATVSMALLLSPADHSQWRMKLNNFPYFPTRNAEGFFGAAKSI